MKNVSICIAFLLLQACGTPLQPTAVKTAKIIPERDAIVSIPEPSHTPAPSPTKPASKTTKTPVPVEDDNFSEAYMYPTANTHTSVKSVKPARKETPLAAPAATMSKEACIAMIGQEKFDRYTQMLGGEAGAIKRCVLLQSMR